MTVTSWRSSTLINAYSSYDSSRVSRSEATLAIRCAQICS